MYLVKFSKRVCSAQISNVGVFEHWSLNVGNLVRSWTLASRHVTELTEVLKQVNKYSNRVFQSKLSE